MKFIKNKKSEYITRSMKANPVKQQDKLTSLVKWEEYIDERWYIHRKPKKNKGEELK